MKNASPVLGNITGFILVVFSIFIAFTYLRDFVEFVTMNLPETPVEILGLLLLFVGAYAVKQGPEVLARLAALLLPPVLLLIAAGIIPGFFTFDSPSVLIPLENWKYTVKGTMFELATFGELLVLTMLPSFFEKNKSTAGPTAISIALNGLIITGLAYTLYGNFGIHTLHVTYKLHELYRNIGRVESLFLILWVIVFFIKISVFFYAAVKGLGEILELKSYGPLVLPAGVIIVFLSLLSFSSYTDYFAFLVTYYPLVVLSVMFFIPALFLVARGLPAPE